MDGCQSSVGGTEAVDRLGTEVVLLLDHVGDDKVDSVGLRAVAAAYADWNTKTGLESAGRITSWLAASAEMRAATMNDLLKSFLTQKGELLAVFRKQLVAVEDLAARLADSLTRIAQTPQHMRFSDELAGALEAALVEKWGGSLLELNEVAR